MQLQPVRKSREVGYPESKAKAVKVMGRWIRRVGVAVAVSAASAFWIGCYGTGGEAPYPDYYYETCDDNHPAPAPDFQFPGTFIRYLCPGQSTHAEVTIEDQQTVRFRLYDNSPYSSSDLGAVLVDPGGGVVATLDTSEPLVDLALTPGTWRVTVTQRSSTSEGEFELQIGDIEM